MRIKSVRVQNFRSLKEGIIEFGELTALIGPNGAGKSSFLKALSMFYEPNASYTEDDFYDRNIEDSIEIQVTFSELGQEAQEKFSSYLSGSTLSVEKVMDFPDKSSNQKYYGSRLTNPDFEGFRNASGNDLRREYEKLQEGEYDGLPDYQNKDIAEQDLRDWEESHPDECEHHRDDGQFFGFNPVGQAELERFTKFLLIPAVRDAGEDAEDSGGGPMAELMDMVVRATLSEKEKLEQLREETEETYKEIINEAAESELKDLEGGLSSALSTFAPGAGVDISWDADDMIDIPMPRTKIRLVEDDFASPVEYTGHGLQRAFIITLLQQLEVRSRHQDDDEEPAKPSLILGIEEPELYQHPNRQRHLMSILSGFEQQEVGGVASSVQVIYSTHSPLMVRMKRFDDIRALRKVSSSGDRPKVTRVKRSGLEEVARELERINDVDRETFSAESTRARLEPVMKPRINEGFFSESVVLVEGPEDRAALVGRAQARNIDFEEKGISVIPCDGKPNLDRPAIIFSDLGIDVYIVFDADFDEDGESAHNRRLLRLVDAPEEDWPEGVHDNHACFHTNLTEVVMKGLGEEYYRETLKEVCDTYGYNSINRAAKNPTVMSDVFEKAEEEGLELPEVDNIIDQTVQID